MINLTPRKASRNSVSSFPSPESFPQEQITEVITATPQSINPTPSIHQQTSSAFITPTSSSSFIINNKNNNREGTMYDQLMNINNVSDLHHQYSFKPSAISSYLKPFMSYFFAHRKNIHDNPSNNKKESLWPERIAFIIGSIIFFALSSFIISNTLNFVFRQKTLPKSSSAKDVIYFLIGEVCTTLLLVVLRLFFNLENSDYDPSQTKHLHKISQHGAEVGVLFEYFTLEEREILFYLSNISIYLIGYASNSLCYAILFELVIVHVGSQYGFFKKDLLGLCVILANIFTVFVGWFNVRVNDSLEVFLLSCSATFMVLMYSTNSSKKRQFSRNESVLPEEIVFVLPKLFRVGHIIFIHLKHDSLIAKNSYVEMFLVMAIGILGSIISFRAYNFYTTSMKRRPVYLGRPIRRYQFHPNQQMGAQQEQFFNPSLTPQQRQQLPQGYYPQQQQQVVFGTPQQNPYNPYQSQQQYPQSQQPAYPYQQQLAFSTPQSTMSDKLFAYPHPPPNIRAFTPQQNVPQRY